MITERMLLPYSITTRSRKNLRERITWAQTMLRVKKAWRHSRGNGVRVAILDTGVARSHPDLQKAVVGYKDFSGDGKNDRDGHGTHVAGIVGARANRIGVIGIAPKCQLLIGKVLNDRGFGTEKWIARGIRWAVEQGADIISMSIGARQRMRRVKRALRAVPDTVYLVAAAGNSGPRMRTVCYPAKYGMVIAVGAIDRRRRITRWSSRGNSVEVVAPGDRIISCYPPRALASMSGTSMACPIVAGIMALALSKHRMVGGETPINNRADMLEHLRRSCKDLGARGKDGKYGYGLIYPVRLIKA